MWVKVRKRKIVYIIQKRYGMDKPFWTFNQCAIDRYIVYISTQICNYIYTFFTLSLSHSETFELWTFERNKRHDSGIDFSFIFVFNLDSFGVFFSFFSICTHLCEYTIHLKYSIFWKCRFYHKNLSSKNFVTHTKFRNINFKK